jgi:predicted RNA-binding protein
MCLVAVYVKEPGGSGDRRLSVSDAAFVECGEQQVTVSDLLGRSEAFDARVRVIDLVKNEVVLEQTGPQMGAGAIRDESSLRPPHDGGGPAPDLDVAGSISREGEAQPSHTTTGTSKRRS